MYTHSTILMNAVRTVYCATSAISKVIATCRDANPATDCTPSANGSKQDVLSAVEQRVLQMR